MDQDFKIFLWQAEPLSFMWDCTWVLKCDASGVTWIKNAELESVLDGAGFKAI